MSSTDSYQWSESVLEFYVGLWITMGLAWIMAAAWVVFIG